jgi:hypothetical protein
MTGYRWDLMLINTLSLVMLGLDWHWFQVMSRWGRAPEEVQWTYVNATESEAAK